MYFFPISLSFLTPFLNVEDALSIPHPINPKSLINGGFVISVPPKPPLSLTILVRYANELPTKIKTKKRIVPFNTFVPNDL